MANLCEITMQVKGEKENIERFFNVLTQNGSVWMGRGADVEIEFLDDGIAEILGSCKWSVYSALIDDALSMRKQKQSGKGMWGDIDNVEDFLTLYEACERFHVNMEVYSKEPGCCFAEHYKYENGCIEEETTSYEEELDEITGDWECSGGFDECFDLADIA